MAVAVLSAHNLFMSSLPYTLLRALSQAAISAVRGSGQRRDHVRQCDARRPSVRAIPLSRRPRQPLTFPSLSPLYYKEAKSRARRRIGYCIMYCIQLTVCTVLYILYSRYGISQYTVYCIYTAYSTVLYCNWSAHEAWLSARGKPATNRHRRRESASDGAEAQGDLLAGPWRFTVKAQLRAIRYFTVHGCNVL